MASICKGPFGGEASVGTGGSLGGDAVMGGLRPAAMAAGPGGSMNGKVDPLPIPTTGMVALPAPSPRPSQLKHFYKHFTHVLVLHTHTHTHTSTNN